MEKNPCKQIFAYEYDGFADEGWTFWSRKLSGFSLHSQSADQSHLSEFGYVQPNTECGNHKRNAFPKMQSENNQLSSDDD